MVSVISVRIRSDYIPTYPAGRWCSRGACAFARLSAGRPRYLSMTAPGTDSHTTGVAPSGPAQTSATSTSPRFANCSAFFTSPAFLRAIPFVADEGHLDLAARHGRRTAPPWPCYVCTYAVARLLLSLSWATEHGKSQLCHARDVQMGRPARSGPVKPDPFWARPARHS
jgi:hypothetical protein